MIYFTSYYHKEVKQMIPNWDKFKTKWQINASTEIELGLERIQYVLRQLNHPEKSVPMIHIAGTNGKGSTIEVMKRILMEEKYFVGTFTSPAVHTVHDQVTLGTDDWTDEMIDRAFIQMKEVKGIERLTDFELLTVAAFITFQDTEVDVALIEVGLGGRDDSTNVITPIASVIPSISYDHTAILGESLTEIATVKGGIIKRQVPIITGKLREEADRVIEQIAKEKRAPLYRLGKEFHVKEGVVEGERTDTWQHRALKGPHQLHNIGVAITALRQSGIQLSETSIAQGVAKASLDHRFSRFNEYVWLDGAHNEGAAKALREVIEETFGQNAKVDIMIGILGRKDIQSVIQALTPVARTWTYIDFSHEEAADYEMVAQYIEGPLTRVDIETLQRELPKKTYPTIITGSLYLLQKLSVYLKNK